jgi:hypothetical protein
MRFSRNLCVRCAEETLHVGRRCNRCGAEVMVAPPRLSDFGLMAHASRSRGGKRTKAIKHAL